MATGQWWAPSFLLSLPEAATLSTTKMALTPIKINSTVKNVNMDLPLVLMENVKIRHIIHNKVLFSGFMENAP